MIEGASISEGGRHGQTDEDVGGKAEDDGEVRQT